MDAGENHFPCYIVDWLTSAYAYSTMDHRQDCSIYESSSVYLVMRRSRSCSVISLIYMQGLAPFYHLISQLKKSLLLLSCYLFHIAMLIESGVAIKTGVKLWIVLVVRIGLVD